MAISFTDTYFTRILEPLRNIIRDEYGTSNNVYVSEAFKDVGGTQSVRLYLVKSSESELFSAGQVREVETEVSLYFKYPDNSPSLSEKSAEKMLIETDRIQQLLFNNRKYSSGGTVYFFDGRIGDIVVNSKTSEESKIDNLQVIKFDFVCKTLMNIS